MVSQTANRCPTRPLRLIGGHAQEHRLRSRVRRRPAGLQRSKLTESVWQANQIFRIHQIHYHGRFPRPDGRGLVVNSLSMRNLFAVLASFVLFGACATTVSSECKQRMSSCLSRCEAADPDRQPALSAGASESYSECESRCKCPDPTRTSGPAAPAGKPTPTGVAPQ